MRAVAHTPVEWCRAGYIATDAPVIIYRRKHFRGFSRRARSSALASHVRSPFCCRCALARRATLPHWHTEWRSTNIDHSEPGMRVRSLHGSEQGRHLAACETRSYSVRVARALEAVARATSCACSGAVQRANTRRRAGVRAPSRDCSSRLAGYLEYRRQHGLGLSQSTNALSSHQSEAGQRPGKPPVGAVSRMHASSSMTNIQAAAAAASKSELPARASMDDPRSRRQRSGSVPAIARSRCAWSQTPCTPAAPEPAPCPCS